jgi:hypothetical protein
VYPTKSVYYALFVEEDKALENLPGLKLQKFPKNKDFAGGTTGNSVSFAVLARPGHA